MLKPACYLAHTLKCLLRLSCPHAVKAVSHELLLRFSAMP